MKLRIGQDIEVAIECVRPTGGRHLFVQGRIAWNRGGEAPDLWLLAHGLPLESLLDLRHERPDITAAPGEDRVIQGFILIAGRAGGPAGMEGFALGAGALAFALPREGLGAPVAEVLARLPWDMAFAVLDAAARDEGLATLLLPDAFAGWIAAVPTLEPSARDQHGLARMDAIASPLGECAVAVTLPRPLARGETLRAVALLPGEDGPRATLLEGPPPLYGETAVTLYGCLHPADQAPAAVPFDLLVELRRPEGGTWFRTTPRLHPAPGFLRMLQDLSAAGEPTDGFGWLRGVLESRRAAFDRAFAAQSPPTAPPPPEAPVVAVLHAVDDPFAARLVFLAAPEIERRAAEVLVLGPREAAAAAADVFLQRGRIPTRTGLDLAATVRRGTYARAALVPVDPPALAEALLEDGMEALFAHRIGGAALAPLLRLAAAAGTPDGAETFGRMARMLKDWSDGREVHVRPERAAGAAGHLIAEHLAALWRGAAPAFGRAATA
ncbi:hypothetical protein [Neoroseomonas soli]|uniref:Uncharacterized protein n=1 Tax=Neoroseomonas soli TaxID=1081025 RepID=A0A9X9X2J0_9PROT|nr:hypothetical protein [Neoroseomonas soli]MBR0673619.1 hypothetical protein [Neoroseomonas soli]